MRVFNRRTARAGGPGRAGKVGHPVVEAVEGRRFLSATVAAVGGVSVDPLPLRPGGKGVTFVAYEDATYHGTVGSFKADLATADNLAYHVKINWGDGKTTGGKLYGRDDGRVDVIGDHAYAENGTFAVGVKVTATPVGLPGQPVPLFIIEAADFKSTAQVRDLKPITYHQSGGIANFQTDITVSPSGVLQLSGTLIKTRPVQLTEAQEDALRSAFASWGSLKASYPNPSGSADVPTVSISYGGKTVTAGALGNPPAAFKLVQRLLEADAGLR